VTESDLPDFRGKVVVIYLRPSERATWALLGPTFEQQGGRLHLVGKPLADAIEGNWANEATVCVPWGEVAYYLVFKTAADYHDAVNRFEAVQPGRKWFGVSRPT
jgi:hypothetical protein